MRDDLYLVNCIVIYGYAGSSRYGWNARLTWQDSKFAELGAVEGEITTRYFEESLSNAIDAVWEVAEQWQLKTIEDLPVTLLYKDDGGCEDYPPPADWKDILCIEAEKRSWQTYLTWEKKEGALA